MSQIDILMATYNGASFVAEQIESIFSQDYANIHLIIRDDGSTDGTREILQSFEKKNPSRITLLPFEQRPECSLGVNGNFSRLMDIATANYIMFADQDDIWHKEKVSNTFQKMMEMEAAFSANAPLLIHTDLTVVDSNLKEIAPSFWKYINVNPTCERTLNRLLAQPVVTGCTVMVNRALLNQAFPVPQHCVMYDFWLALVAAAFGQIGVIEKATMLYRQHNKNVVGAKKFWSLCHWKKQLNNLKTSETKKFEQGKELLKRYGDSLGHEQLETLRAYLSLPKASFITRGYIIFKYHLFRSGILRTVISIYSPKLKEISS